MRDWLALAHVEGVGPRLFRALLDRFGTPDAVLRAPAAALKEVPGLGPTVMNRIIRATNGSHADEQLHRAEQLGVDVLTLADERYPAMLKAIADPPPVLYVRGRLEPRDHNAVAIVGARRPGHYGRRVSRYLALNCAQFGFTVVSGLAAGVDTEAHEGALEGGGRTIAVLASGVDVAYPKYNEVLLHRVVDHGAVVSEMPLGATPEKGAFPARNRIIAGMTLGTIVTAAAQRSGALITARHAMEQGREVMAVPGDIFASVSDGVHALLRDGATLVQDPFDVRATLEPHTENLTAHLEAAAAELPADMAGDETVVFNFLSIAPVYIDDVMGQCGLTAAQATTALLTLEMRGLVRQLEGKQFVRTAG